jgi:NADH dehydrogenase
LPRIRFFSLDLADHPELNQVLTGCDSVVHCAGINREMGVQTYERVHVESTRNLVESARKAGVKKFVLISFLRARPDCGSAYHESKWAAEEIVRLSGLDYTILKCGVIYGRGDHMLDHLSHAFYTFPFFAFVGFQDKHIRPNAVEDVARIAAACVLDGALSKATVAVLGPEQLTLRQAVVRVAKVTGRMPLMFPVPVWCHHVLGWGVERAMNTPLVSRAQVRMLCEGLAEPAPTCELVPVELAPRIPFSEEQIRKGLPNPGPFTWRDLRCCLRSRNGGARHHSRHAFFEMP